jgi:hypothetical protein
VGDSGAVIFSTECPSNPEQGIFRSKMDIESTEFKTVKDVFLGKKVGETFEVDIMGHKHNVTILGARKKDATAQNQG